MRTEIYTIGVAVLASALGISASAQAQDYSAPPSFGSVTLNAGFSPDPHVRNLTAGGSIRAETRFSSCRGSIANAPDYSLYYTAGSFPLILTVDSNSDTTLVVNGPDAQWYCDDDGAQSPLNPLVRFNNPQSGRYDIWVGTYSQGAGVPATLFISEVGEFTRDSVGGGYQAGYSSGLDISRPARFGDVSLIGGFLPDPWQRSLTAGGTVSIQDAIGDRAAGPCRGSVTTEPTLQLSYDGLSDLHIYTSGSADTTLAINAPDGSWYCDDDTIGTDAGITFYSGPSGVYDIYVGVFGGGQSQTVLNISEIEMGYARTGK